MSDRITLAELASGLAQYRDLFGSLDVFADDIAELRDDVQAPTSTELRKVADQPDAYLFEHAGEKFVLQVTREGVARIRYADDSVAVGALLGSAFGAAVGAASSKKGGGWAKGLLLGMLAGTAVGAASSPSRPKRVLTVRFDPSTRSWAAYDGGLVTWLKAELNPTA
jgi:hypothetical protein